MNISSLLNTVQKRVESKEEDEFLKEIGTIIKRKRLELNYTQELIANGICSISYLSKIENSSIKPNAEYIEELMEKMNIDSKNLLSSDFFTKPLNNILKCYYFYNNHGIEKVYESLEGVEENTRIEIIHYIYYIYKSDIENAMKVYRDLNKCTNNLDNTNLGCYLLFTSKLLRKLNKFDDSFSILTCIKKLKIPSEFFLPLYYLELITVTERLGYTVMCTEYINKYLNNYMNYISSTRYLWVTVINAKLHFHTGNIDEAYDLLKNVVIDDYDDEDSINEYKYILAYILFLKDEHIKSLEYINTVNQEYNNVIWFNLKYDNYKAMNDIDSIVKIIDDSKQYCFDNAQYADIIEYQYRINEFNEEVEVNKDYMNNVIIPYYIETQNIYRLNYYISKIVAYLSSISRYKDALSFVSKYVKTINKIHKILN